MLFVLDALLQVLFDAAALLGLPCPGRDLLIRWLSSTAPFKVMSGAAIVGAVGVSKLGVFTSFESAADMLERAERVHDRVTYQAGQEARFSRAQPRQRSCHCLRCHRHPLPRHSRPHTRR